MDSPGKLVYSTINTRLIDVIKIRKKENVGLGILFGAISGLVVGGIVDLVYYSTWKNDEPKKANNLGEAIANAVARDPRNFAIDACLIGIAFIGTGIGIGAAVGSAKISIPIEGSQEKFNENKSMLNDYSIKYNPGIGNKTFSKLRDTIVDIDGNQYHTLALGGQVWMTENLKVTHYRDGSEIPGITKNVTGSGCQYNWSVVSGSRKLCPAGWHVPFLSEWKSLFNSLGGENGAASKLEENFSVKGQGNQWWSSTEQDADHAQSFYLNNQTIGIMFTDAAKTSGLSVRCIRD